MRKSILESVPRVVAATLATAWFLLFLALAGLMVVRGRSLDPEMTLLRRLGFAAIIIAMSAPGLGLILALIPDRKIKPEARGFEPLMKQSRSKSHE